MVRKEEIVVNKKDLYGGKGDVSFFHWLADDEKAPHLGLIAEIRLAPGTAVGDHGHEGEAEIYKVISGKAKYNDNGVDVLVEPGDIMVCYSGETHGIINTGDEDFVFFAMIVKE